MYRLTNARSIYHNGFHNAYQKVNTYESIIVDKNKCCFCRTVLLGQSNLENLSLLRHQSTRTQSALHKSSKKKVKYKNNKRYAELLAVSDKAMTEMKVSINKLHADHLSKLAASSVSLGQLHQLTNKSQKVLSSKVVDLDLLQKVKNNLLNNKSNGIKEINLEDDKCALIFTSNLTNNVEDKFKSKQYMDLVKKSYYDFRKATLNNQRLQDLQFAINQGLTQEFDLVSRDKEESQSGDPLNKGAHAVFKELFFDKHLDKYDQDFLVQLSGMKTGVVEQTALEEIDEEHPLEEIYDPREVLEYECNEHLPDIQGLSIKKAKQEIRAKKKAKRDQKRARQQENMKNDLKVIEAKGRQSSLHKLLASHLQLLCSLNMIDEGRQVIQYYRLRGQRSPDQPKVTDIKVYNIMLHGCARLCDYNKCLEILSYLKEDDIKPNIQTFAAIFECVERSSLIDKESVLKNYLQDMSTQNISLNDLVDKSVFKGDEQFTVIKAIRRIEPNFEPIYTPPELDYSCPLLERLKLTNIENRKGLLTSPAEGVLTLEEMKQRVRNQIEIEIAGDVEIKNIDVKNESSDELIYHRQKLQETEDGWRKVIKEAFVRNLSTLKSQSNVSHIAISLYPYLKVLEVDEMVEMVMKEINKLVEGSESFSPTLKILQKELGTLIYQRYLLQQYRKNGVLDKISTIYEKYCEWYLQRQSIDGSDVPYNCRQVWQILCHQHRDGASMNTLDTPWPMEICQNIGKFLYNIIINDVKIDVNIFKPKAKKKLLPAVYKVHRPWGRLVRLELKPHPTLARLRAAAAPPALYMRSGLVPGRAPPPPWSGPAAVLRAHTPLVRMPYHVVQQHERIEEASEQSLYPVLDSLNQLGEVPWVVNQPILDLQLQIFRSGGNKKLSIPPPPSALDLSQFEAADTKSSAFRRRVAINRARSEMYSLWCDMLYKLSLANHYRHDIFWLPHNLDFRGRVYAVPPHLSVLGADPARALLTFGRRRPLGDAGLSWLKLHAVNLTGAVKRNTVSERLAYAESVLDKILDSADNPLDGEGWWKESEEPWQTLACCMEIANAIRSGNPEEYLCGFPVHQDGSCNGLQHYAALGADGPGAAAVNLAPATRPRDVYSDTARRVEEMRARDAAQGVPAAIVLENFVRRKVIKQTVMTTVYGVTRFGARLQIAKQLKDIDDFPKEHVWACSQYLTMRTFDSLREMFTSTRLIQDWFTECAKLISGVCGESVEWVTPLGLPVVQPYYHRSSPSTAQYKAPLDYKQRPCTMKQRNSFPPNFIHSLDSSHMMLTGLHCQTEGITFVSVHDCFWTHPDTVHIMNKICREQFVALHSQPILEDLSKYLVQRYSYADCDITDDSSGTANKRRVNALLRKVPPKGDFKLENVLDSVYFFS